jgi:hypothetical protein
MICERFSKFIGLRMIAAAILWALSPSAVLAQSEVVVYDLKHRASGQPVTDQSGKPISFTVTRYSKGKDFEDMNKVIRLGNGLNLPLRQTLLDNEAEHYDAAFPPATNEQLSEIHQRFDIGYDRSSNEPTNRQICPSIVFAKLIGGTFVLSSIEGKIIVDACATPLVEKDAQPGDFVYWSKKSVGGHFALVYRVDQTLVGSVIRIVSKDERERIHIGPVEHFPAGRKDFVRRSYYRIDWEKFTVVPRPSKSATAVQKHYLEYYFKTPRVLKTCTRGGRAQAEADMALIKRFADEVKTVEGPNNTFRIIGKAWMIANAGRGYATPNDPDLLQSKASREKDGFQTRISTSPNWAMFILDQSGGRIAKEFLPPEK